MHFSERSAWYEYTLKLPIEYGNRLQSVMNTLASVADEIFLQEIWLFGSVARGMLHPNSDIDLMLIVEKNPEVARRYMKILDIGDGFPEVDITIRTLESLHMSEYVFTDYVLRDRLILWQRQCRDADIISAGNSA